MSDSDLVIFLVGLTVSESLKNAFADSKEFGINLGFVPLTSDTSTQLPSISDLEHWLTALVSYWQSEKEIGSSDPASLLIVISTGLTGDEVVSGEMMPGRSIKRGYPLTQSLANFDTQKY